MLSTVQSVTGPIGPDEVGLALPHEHVFINMSPTEPRDGFMTVWEERARPTSSASATPAAARSSTSPTAS